MGCAPTSSGDRPPRPVGDLVEQVRAAVRWSVGLARRGAGAVGPMTRRIPLWRMYGSFLQTAPGQLFLDHGGVLGSAAARVLSPGLEPGVPWTHMPVSLAEARIALITSAGIHRASDPPFDVDAASGDPSFREIPSDISPSELRFAHTHYGHQRVRQDVNVLLPLERLSGLVRDGLVGGVGPRAYSFGFTVQTEELVAPGRGTAHELVQRLREDRIDAVLLSPA